MGDAIESTSASPYNMIKFLAVIWILEFNINLAKSSSTVYCPLINTACSPLSLIHLRILIVSLDDDDYNNENTISTYISVDTEPIYSF